MTEQGSEQTSFPASPFLSSVFTFRIQCFLVKIRERKKNCLEFFSLKISVPRSNTVLFIMEPLFYQGVNHVSGILRLHIAKVR